MRFFIVAAFCVSLVFAQLGTDVPVSETVVSPTHPFDSNICAMSGSFNNVDLSSYYTSSFTGTTKICVKNYLNVCPSPSGVATCNTWTAVCKDVKYDYNDQVQHPNTASTMANRPQLCLEAGGFMAPDAATIIIAQIIFSNIIMILAYVLFVYYTFSAPTGAGYIQIIAFVFLLDAMILTFSYYYLNAIIVFAAVLAAGVCFVARNDYASLTGFAICLLALYWVTFQYGLGNIQHQSRFSAGLINTDYYEQQCNAYYRGYFFWPNDLHHEGDNIAVQYNGLCDRQWLAAELFFMILAEQLLVVYIAVGAWLQFGRDDDSVAHTAAAQPQQ